MNLKEIEEKYGSEAVTWIKDSLSNGKIIPYKHDGNMYFTVALRNPLYKPETMHNTFFIDEYGLPHLTDESRYSDFVRVVEPFLPESR